jgi:hypothetical protein
MKKRIPISAVALLLAALFLLLPSCRGGSGDPETQPPGTSVYEDPVPSTEMKEIISADGNTDYIVVRSDTASAGEAEIIGKLVSHINGIAASRITYTTDWARNPLRQDREIVIGIFDENDGKFPGKSLLGSGSYAIVTDGERVTVSAGDLEGLEKAVEYMCGMIKKGEAFELPADSVTAFSASKKFDDIKIGESLISGFSLEESDSDYIAGAAEELRRMVFALTGKLLGYGGEKLIRFETDNAKPGEVSASESGGDILIKAGAEAGFYRAIRELIALPAAEAAAGGILSARASKNFGGYVTYEDYGAVGDGKTDDIAAIAAAHAAANGMGLPVLSREDATYYIGGSDRYAVVKTDTDWSVSKFIIDDRDVANIGTNVFNVEPDFPLETLDIKKVAAGDANIGVRPGYPMYVIIYNDNVKQYIRQGANQDSGAAMTDVILIDADGNVDPSTPVLWDFDEVTRNSARRCDDRPVTVRGGIFTTVANSGSTSAYYNRGIRIRRSGTTVDSLTHYVTGEGADGQPYSGFLNIMNCDGVTVKNTVLTGHKTYKKIGSAGTTVSMGTYDMLVTSCTSFRAVDCSQTNDINDSTRWGVFASNYAKNILFERCVFSRFDAHKGVCNVTLTDCSFGHQGINLIGHGLALIEGCSIYGTYFVNLRNDYGSTWNGDLVIRNCDYYPGNGKNTKPVIINGSNDGTHDFGYECTLPRNIEITNFVIHDKSSDTVPYLFSAINPNYKTAPRQIKMPEKITVTGFSAASGHALELAANPAMLPGVSIGG